jgi:hypothetical protein
MAPDPIPDERQPDVQPLDEDDDHVRASASNDG